MADWVELFAPPIFETLRPTTWPQIVSFDTLPLAIRVRDPLTGQPVRGGKVVTNILAAYGWPNGAVGEDGGRLLALRAYPNFGFNQGFPHYLDFFRSLKAELEGHPFQFVVDQEREIIRALEHVWPRGQLDTPDLFICHWHLRERVRWILDEAGVGYPDPLREAIDHQRGRVSCSCAFCDEMTFLAFESAARTRQIRKLDTWLNSNAKLVLWQLAHRYQPRRARITVGPIEQTLAEVREIYKRRAGVLHNRERMNRRLMLVQLELNHQANASHYAKVIRDELLANGGHGGERYLVDDEGAKSSLQLY